VYDTGVTGYLLVLGSLACFWREMLTLLAF
jgi:hypothetical protein